MYDYDRRNILAARTLTPVLDKLMKNHSKVVSECDAAIKKVHALAGKAESKKSDPDTHKLFTQAYEPAYKMYEEFRSFIQASTKEEEILSHVDQGSDTAREVKSLIGMLKDTSKAMAWCQQAAQDKDLDMGVKALHDLAVALSSVKTVFGQLTQAYNTLVQYEQSQPRV